MHQSCDQSTNFDRLTPMKESSVTAEECTEVTCKPSVLFSDSSTVRFDIEQDFWCIVVEYLAKCVDIINLRMCSKELMSICRKSSQCILIHTENMKANKIKETINFEQLIFCSNNSLEDKMLHSLSSNKTDLTLIITKCFRVRNICDVLRTCKNAALCDIQFQRNHIFPAIRNKLFDNLKVLILTNCSFETDTMTEFLLSVPKTLTFIGFGGTTGLQENLLSVLHNSQMNADQMIHSQESIPALHVGEEDPNWALVNPQIGVRVDHETDENNHNLNRMTDMELNIWEAKKGDIKIMKTKKASGSGFIIEVTFLQKSEKILLRRLFPAANLLDLQTNSITEIEEVLKNEDLGYTLRSALCLCSNFRNQTLLHIACSSGDVEKVFWLLKRMGSRVDLKDVKGDTVMHKICESKSPRSSECASIVMSHSSLLAISAVNTLFEHNHLCETPLYLVAFRGHPDTLQAILSSPNMIQKEDTEKRRIFFKSVGGSRGLKRMEDVAKLGYEESMLDSYTCDDKGFTPVHAGVIRGCERCVSLLLDGGFRADYPNAYKHTPLHLSYRSGSPDMINILKSKSASDTKNKSNNKKKGAKTKTEFTAPRMNYTGDTRGNSNTVKTRNVVTSKFSLNASAAEFVPCIKSK